MTTKKKIGIFQQLASLKKEHFCTGEKDGSRRTPIV
jgi:hypothetical protein